MTDWTNNKASRRNLFQLGLGAAAAVSALSVTAAEAQSKIEPAMVQYQKDPKNGQHCSICAQWEPPNACKLINGVIDPNGWCAIYAAKA